MKLPTPQRGQPLDVSFIGDIVASINSIWDKIVINASAYSSLWTLEGRKALKSSESKIATGQVTIQTTSATANGFEKFSYEFEIAFRYPPIVTATVQNANTNDFSRGLRVVITNTTTSSVDGIVIFETASTESAQTLVNLIAIGVPV